MIRSLIWRGEVWLSADDVKSAIGSTPYPIKYPIRYICITITSSDINEDDDEEVWISKTEIMNWIQPQSENDAKLMNILQSLSSTKS